MHDLIIRGGNVVDGTGAPAFVGDIAVDDGLITAVGTVDGEAREVIDAGGLMVTPGFVDIHTHFDGQVTWDPLLSPSCWHGVTTVVMGNCGVGFAPVAPERREWLIGLMEGVEDIPGTALSAGIQWDWETFPEYLDALERLPKMMDVGAQVPHGAVRAYVMGERGALNEPANPEDIQEMARIVGEGIEAGALGFSTSRTLAHRAIDGEPVPGTFAAEDELFAIGRALGDLGKGIFEVSPAGIIGEDLSAPDREFSWMRRLSTAIQRPVSFGMVQHDNDPTAWRKTLEESHRAEAEGAQIYPQVAGRPIAILMTLRGNNPFINTQLFKELAGLPFEEKVKRLREPESRARAIAEAEVAPQDLPFWRPTKVFRMSDPPNYEPEPDQSIAAIAEREGKNPFGVLYDALLEMDGRQMLMMPTLNYTDFNLDAVREMLVHPNSAFGLADGGAHCGYICDASMPTFMLTHWVRDRSRGERLPLEFGVRKMTSDTAKLYGLLDRGVIKPGYKADFNVIDFERLNLKMPDLAYDLPADGRRLIQKAEGYVATIISGQVVMREGEETGARPGQLLRGARPAPTAV